jgi:hypothetical protein
VRWFVRAGTDRDSVVSIGLLRESLRGPRKFGCPGPKSGSNSQTNRSEAPNRVRPRGVRGPKPAGHAVMPDERPDTWNGIQKGSTGPQHHALLYCAEKLFWHWQSNAWATGCGTTA